MSSTSNSDEDLDLYAQFVSGERKLGTPRLGAYPRLLARFYEVLFFARSLSQTRGHHTKVPRSMGPEQDCRRRFLRNLCYICDSTKGGSSCTAIGLEETDAFYKFWVSSNAQRDVTVHFLKDALTRLALLNKSSEEDKRRYSHAFLEKCIEHSQKRIKKERKALQASIKAVRNTPTTRTRDKTLLEWLDRFPSDDEDHVRLCQMAHDAFRSDYMTVLNSHAREDDSREFLREQRRSPLSDVRHYIGRLANHIVSYKDLIRDSAQLSNILDMPKVDAVDRLPSVTRPVIDSHTTLDGILNRMIKREGEKSEIKDGLLELDRKRGGDLFKCFLSKYKECNPQIHAEIGVHEHFYRHGLNFAFNDRFIACSKPSCLCCMLYFKYHKARVVLPESHQKVWPNWSPPAIEEYKKGDEASNMQRDIMNKIIEDLRGSFTEEVLDCNVPPRWHPDSQSAQSEIRPTEESLDLIVEKLAAELKITTVSRTVGVRSAVDHVDPKEQRVGSGSDSGVEGVSG